MILGAHRRAVAHSTTLRQEFVASSLKQKEQTERYKISTGNSNLLFYNTHYTRLIKFFFIIC